LKSFRRIVSFLPIFLLIMFTLSQSLQLANASLSLASSSYPPKASFTYTPPNPGVNGTVTFDASDSTPDGGTIINYTWNFSDSSPLVTETDPVTTHVYTEAGTYTVTLNVTDSEGLWCATSKPVTISPVHGPTAKFTYSPTEPYVNGTTFFDASSSTQGWNGTTYPPIIKYEWNFSDDTPIVTESDPTTTHIYQTEGNHTVTLNVTDTMGWWNATSQTLTVHIGTELTVITDKLEYYIELDKVQIQGNLTMDREPVADGLIALEVDNPYEPVVFRTLKTGEAPISGTAINITYAFLCDEFGKPIPGNGVKKGPYPKYFNATGKNIGNETVSPLLTLNFYQNLNPFFSTGWSVGQLYPGDQFSTVVSFLIPNWIQVGSVTVYVSVFSAYPRLGGYPYCEEKSSTFEILDPSDPPSETPTSATNLSSNTNGTYNLAFQIPPDARQGLYTVYVSTRHGPQQVANNATFTVKLPGDVDGDGWVSSYDLFALADAFGTTPGDPNWNPQCDFDYDNWVSSYDLFTLADFFGRTA